MKTVTVDGVDCILFMSQADDGGMIISTLVPTANANEYRELRSWIGKGIQTNPDGSVVKPTQAETDAARDQARAIFDAIDVAAVRARKQKAMQTGTSGRIADQTIIKGTS